MLFGKKRDEESSKRADLNSLLQTHGFINPMTLGFGGFCDAYLVSNGDKSATLRVYDFHKHVDEKTKQVDPFAKRCAQKAFSREQQVSKYLGLQSDSFPTYYGYRENNRYGFLLTGYVPGLNLNETRISEASLLRGMVFLSTQLRELHALGLIHADVKPGNLLYASGPFMQDERLGLIDFGSTRSIPHHPSLPEALLTKEEEGTIHGSPKFIPPEYQDQTYTTKADVFGMGLTIAHKLTGCTPFDVVYSRQDNRNAQLHALFTWFENSVRIHDEFISQIGRKLNKKTKRFIEAATQPDPNKRLSLPEFQRGLEQLI